MSFTSLWLMLWGLICAVLAGVSIVVARSRDQEESGQAMPTGGCLFRVAAWLFAAGAALSWSAFFVVAAIRHWRS